MTHLEATILGMVAGALTGGSIVYQFVRYLKRTGKW